MNRKDRRANRRQLPGGTVRAGQATIADLLATAAAHHNAGRYRDAVRLLRDVIAREPTHAAAHDAIAMAYQALGRRDDAIRHFEEAISFGLLGVETLLQQSPVVMAALSRFADPLSRPLKLAELTGPRGSFIDDALLVALLKTRIVTDIDIERFLTAARRALLAAAAEEAPAMPNNAFAFCCALAQQCFLNEYVFAQSDSERAAVAHLTNRALEAIETDSDIPPAWLAVLASYRPLHALAGAEKLATRRWPKPLDAVLTRQLREPLADAAEAATTPAITSIDNEISRQVQRQYEESPYPRWSIALPVRATTVDEYLRAHFAMPPSWRPAGDREILIAGCGTGEHAVEVGRRFPKSNVLAVDISRTSLGYARRKTRELGIGNVEYAQADILQLGRLGRKFDLIDSAGVLHHLADPEAGWRILVSLLRPGGLMRIGLYSEIGRRQLDAGRELIAERGYAPNADDIRAWRQDLIQRGQFIRSSDFFSTSGCRDMCFNVMEHRFTLPRIKASLDANRLTLLGMEVSPETLERFAEKNPEPEARTDLDRWDAFEQAHPRTFEAMYFFWAYS